MTAHVVLTANCPQVAPVFILDIVYHSHRTALNDVHLKVSLSIFLFILYSKTELFLWMQNVVMSARLDTALIC